MRGVRLLVAHRLVPLGHADSRRPVLGAKGTLRVRSQPGPGAPGPRTRPPHSPWRRPRRCAGHARRKAAPGCRPAPVERPGVSGHLAGAPSPPAHSPLTRSPLTRRPRPPEMDDAILGRRSTGRVNAQAREGGAAGQEPIGSGRGRSKGEGEGVVWTGGSRPQQFPWFLGLIWCWILSANIW